MAAHLGRVVLVAALWTGVTFAQGAGRGQTGGCNRLCLEGVVSKFISSLVAHDPSTLPGGANITYTENGQQVPIGSGTWPLAAKPGKYRHIFSDPSKNQVAAITTLTENGIPVIYVLRLKADDSGEVITEAETLIVRDSGGAVRYENMTVPEAVWLEAVPQEARIPRERLVSQTNKYYTGMQGNDPRGDYSFFHKDCNRLEDGLQTTNQKTGDAYGHSNDTAFASLGCEAQFQTGFLGFVTEIRDRRFPVVDEERQVVFAITTLDHNGTVRSLPSVNGTSSPIPPYFDVPRSLLAAEAFRLDGEKLFRIEMVLTEVPYGVGSVFEAPRNASATGTSLSVATPCGRECLEGLVGRVLTAMLNNDRSGLPLADGVRYSENGQFLPLGDGLWQTLGEVAMPPASPYSAIFADLAASNAGYWGLIKEETTAGVLALRVYLDSASGKISEIESIVVRAESRGARGGTVTLMRPPLPVEWDGRPLGSLDASFKAGARDAESSEVILIALVDSYFHGLEKHSAFGVPFTPGCVRRDNGALQSNGSCAAQMAGEGAAPNGLHGLTTAVRDRRFLVVDAEKGIVLAVAMVDSPGIGPAPLKASQQVPGTYMVPQLIKVEDGYISRVEGMVKWMPFGYTAAAWE